MKKMPNVEDEWFDDSLVPTPLVTSSSTEELSFFCERCGKTFESFLGSLNCQCFLYED